jgi:hypothetical protein
MGLRTGLCAGQRAIHPSSRHLALCMVILGLFAAARPWTPSSWDCRRTIIVLALLSEENWNSVVSVAIEDRWFLHPTHFSTQGSRSVSLCGLPLRGWAVVAPRDFHFTITAHRDDRGSSSEAEIWRTGLLKRWHPIEVPRWKSLSSSVRPFNVCLWRLHGGVFNFIHLSATGVAKIAESTNLKGCPHTLYI